MRDSKPSGLVAGVARADITPPVGIAHLNWGSQTHVTATGIDPVGMFATALVISDGKQKFAVDWVGMVLKRVEQAFPSALCLFFQVAAGNQGPIEGGTGDVNVAHRLGSTLGLQAAALAIQIDTVRREPVFEDYLESDLRTKWTQPADLSPIQVDVQILRIGDMAIVAMPGEPFAEIGAATKKASPFAVTMFCANSTGKGATTCLWNQSIRREAMKWGARHERPSASVKKVQ